MKRVYYFIFLIIVISTGSIISCENDTTSFATEDLPDVVIDTTDMSELTVLQFEELEVTPDLNLEGVSKSDLSFEWRLYFSLGDTVSTVIGDKRNLEGYEIELTPTTEDRFYRVTYTITDETTGLKYIMSWPLNVLNSLGEGLVVAEEAEGGNSDLSLIMAPQVTTDYSEVSIKRNVYSSINGEYISGVVKDIQQTAFGTSDPSLLVITDNSIINIDRVEFTYQAENEDLFYYVPPEGFNSQSLGIVNRNGDFTVYLANNNLFGTNLPSTGKFEAPLDSDFLVPDEIAVNEQAPASNVVRFYDEAHEQFVYIGDLSPYGGVNELTAVPSVSDGAFDPANVPDKENLAVNFAQNGNSRHLLKDKTTGEYHLYVLNGSDPPAPLAKYDFTNAPDIENAEHFVLPDNQRVMYYATDTKIYAVLYSTSTPVFEERYTAPAGEEITMLQLYHEVDYPTDGPYLDTDGRQLVMSTYDGSEGKVYLLPVTNLGVGNIDEANVTSFEGFGRITAITPQK